MNFQYLQTVTMNANLEIEDIGNCAIKAFTDIGREYILIIETRIGWTRIYQYGPIVQEEQWPSSLNECYFKIEFNERKIKQTIEKFLNMMGITQAFEVTKTEALEDCKSIIEFMKESTF